MCPTLFYPVPFQTEGANDDEETAPQTVRACRCHFGQPDRGTRSQSQKEYCNNQEFYTSTGGDNGKIYPHLHCLSNGLTFSASASNHKNFLQGSNLNAGQANGACTTPGIGQIKAVIKKVCDDYGKTCNDCN